MTSLFQTAVIGAAVVVAFVSSVRGDCLCCTADGTQYYVDDLHGNDDDLDDLCEQRPSELSTCGPKLAPNSRFRNGNDRSILLGLHA